MIIDCHGHYTTSTDDLKVGRQEWIDVHGELSKMRATADAAITDDQIREVLEAHQLRLPRERGTDLTIFSPRAGGMGHHIGNEEMSRQWSRVCNDLIRRICDLYPSNFAPVCQLPQSPGCPVSPAATSSAPRRCRRSGRR